MGLLEGFAWGCLGGVLGEVLNWFRIRKMLHRGVPEWARSFGYWLVTILMAVIGGILVVVYLRSGAVLTPMVSINIGLSAPIVLATLVAQTPNIEPGNVD